MSFLGSGIGAAGGAGPSSFNFSSLTGLGGAIGLGLGGLLGGAAAPAPNINFNPVGFSGGGLTGSFANGSYGVTAGADRNAAVGGVANTFAQQAQALGQIAGQWTPGFSALRNAQLTALNNNRAQAIGNLRDNLAQRRILGSSFAQNSLANADQDYQNQIAATLANTYLQELQATQQTTNQMYQAAGQSFQTTLSEMNLEAGLAAQLGQQASSTMLAASTAQAQLDAQAAKGTGSFFGSLGQMIGSALPAALPFL